MRLFAGAFQILIRHNLPVFLLMTGLYENINSLQNEKNLTFLFRAPKMYLKVLNTAGMADSYEKNLSLSSREALELAKATQGYSFAFQVVGYFMYEHKSDYKAALPEIRVYLDDYVYDKVWMELSSVEKSILVVMSEEGSQEVKTIKESLNIKPNEFSVYRDRLIKKGIADGSVRGKLSFSLPFFAEYVKEH